MDLDKFVDDLADIFMIFWTSVIAIFSILFLIPISILLILLNHYLRLKIYKIWNYLP